MSKLNIASYCGNGGAFHNETQHLRCVPGKQCRSNERSITTDQWVTGQCIDESTDAANVQQRKCGLRQIGTNTSYRQSIHQRWHVVSREGSTVTILGNMNY